LTAPRERRRLTRTGSRDVKFGRVGALVERKKRPWWVWLLLAIVALLVIGAVAGEPDDEKTDDDQAQTTSTSTSTTETGTGPGTATVPSRTAADARAAVDDDDYAQATAIAAALTARDAKTISRRIAHRLGTRALAAVRMGDRRTARRLIIEAKDYPSTARVSAARTQYKAAKARSALRRQQQRAAARQRAAVRREREQAAAAPPPPPAPPEASGCDPNYSGCVPPYPPDVDCGDLSGSVQVTGSDPHGLDRDGDGVGCE
jgi:hypothetical protein